MKKLVTLVLMAVLFFLSAFQAPLVSAANTCDWSLKNDQDFQGLNFCYGGFTNEQELRNTRVEFQCITNCSKLQQVGSMQTFDNAGAMMPNGGNIFSCVGGGIDQSFINSTRQIINDQSAACGISGVVPLALGVVTGGALTITLGLAGTGVMGGTAVPACLKVVNQFVPTVQARLVDKTTGNVLCSQNISLKVDANNQVSALNNAGGIKAGTVIQSGIGLEFCTPKTGGQGIKTALGCISTDPSAFIGFILTIGIGLAGGIAFLLILLGGFQILTSAGNPEQLNAGRELVSSAIAGLLLIIFSVFILRIIGVDILGIPGFTK